MSPDAQNEPVHERPNCRKCYKGPSQKPQRGPTPNGKPRIGERLTVRVVVSKSETGGCLEASAARAASYSIREFSQRRASQMNIDCGCGQFARGAAGILRQATT